MRLSTNRTFTLFWGYASCIFALVCDSHAINGGAAVGNAPARAPHHSVGATVWSPGPFVLREPCTAVQLCENVVLTAGHCLNFNPPGEMYFTTVEDINGLAGPGDRYARVEREFKRAGQTTTARIDKNTIDYGESYDLPIGPGQGIPVGIALAAFKKNETIAGMFPDLVPQNFMLAQDMNSLDSMHADFLNPGNAATLGKISGYGDRGLNRLGSGSMRKGTMRFLSWIEPKEHRPQGNRRPLPNSLNGFLLQFSRGKDDSAHACRGDSGGPVFFGGEDSDLLGGIMETTSDRDCTNPKIKRAIDDERIMPQVNNYISLLYTANRQKIRDYMVTHCSDGRTIDLKTGKNAVETEEHTDVEDWTCSVSSAESDSIDYFGFLQGWMDVTVQIYPDYPWFQVMPGDSSLLPYDISDYCNGSIPTDSPEIPTAPIVETAVDSIQPEVEVPSVTFFID